MPCMIVPVLKLVHSLRRAVAQKIQIPKISPVDAEPGSQCGIHISHQFNFFRFIFFRFVIFRFVFFSFVFFRLHRGLRGLPLPRSFRRGQFYLRLRRFRSQYQRILNTARAEGPPDPAQRRLQKFIHLRILPGIGRVKGVHLIGVVLVQKPNRVMQYGGQPAYRSKHRREQQHRSQGQRRSPDKNLPPPQSPAAPHHQETIDHCQQDGNAPGSPAHGHKQKAQHAAGAHQVKQLPPPGGTSLLQHMKFQQNGGIHREVMQRRHITIGVSPHIPYYIIWPESVSKNLQPEKSQYGTVNQPVG